MREYENVFKPKDPTRLRIREFRDEAGNQNRHPSKGREPFGVNTAIDPARAIEEMQRRLTWSEAAGNIRNELLAGADVHAVFTSIAQFARSLTEADEAFIAQPRDSEQSGRTLDELVVTVAEGGFSHGLLGAEVAVSANDSGPMIVAWL